MPASTVEMNRSENDGQGYIERLRASGRPDVFGRLVDVLRKVAAVEEDFAQRYGFTPNRDLNARIAEQLREADEAQGLEQPPPNISPASTVSTNSMIHVNNRTGNLLTRLSGP